MAAFELSSLNDQQLDWVILRSGGVALYWRPEILTDDLRWLESHGYVIQSFDAAEWKTEERMHEALSMALSFPNYYGKNLDALDECMCDDLVLPDIGGLVLVLNHYDQFMRAIRDDKRMDESSVDPLLDIFARAIRYQSLMGKRLVVLVQSDDPEIQFGPLGSISARWNSREWLNKSRGL